jgi:hypothetical protein
MNYRDLAASDSPTPSPWLPEWASRLSPAQRLSFIAEMQVAAQFPDREMAEQVLDAWEQISNS